MDDFQHVFPRRPYLNGEILYRGYWGLGRARSTRHLVNIAIQNKMFNPQTGNPPHWQGCWKAAWRWALMKENHQTAYEVFNNAMADEGKYFTFEQFKTMLVEMYGDAFQPRTEAQRMKFLRNSGLEKYYNAP